MYLTFPYHITIPQLPTPEELIMPSTMKQATIEDRLYL